MHDSVRSAPTELSFARPVVTVVLLVTTGSLLVDLQKLHSGGLLSAREKTDAKKAMIAGVHLQEIASEIHHIVTPRASARGSGPKFTFADAPDRPMRSTPLHRRGEASLQGGGANWAVPSPKSNPLHEGDPQRWTEDGRDRYYDSPKQASFGPRTPANADGQRGFQRHGGWGGGSAKTPRSRLGEEQSVPTITLKTPRGGSWQSNSDSQLATTPRNTPQQSSSPSAPQLPVSPRAGSACGAVSASPSPPKGGRPRPCGKAAAHLKHRQQQSPDSPHKPADSASPQPPPQQQQPSPPQQQQRPRWQQLRQRFVPAEAAAMARRASRGKLSSMDMAAAAAELMAADPSLPPPPLTPASALRTAQSHLQGLSTEARPAQDHGDGGGGGGIAARAIRQTAVARSCTVRLPPNQSHGGSSYTKAAAAAAERAGGGGGAETKTGTGSLHSFHEGFGSDDDSFDAFDSFAERAAPPQQARRNSVKTLSDVLRCGGVGCERGRWRGGGTPVVVCPGAAARCTCCVHQLSRQSPLHSSHQQPPRPVDH